MSGSISNECLNWAQNFTGLDLGANRPLSANSRPGGPASGQPAPATDANTRDQKTIEAALAAQSMKEQMERWRVLQDTQTKIFEIQQDVTENWARTTDKAHRTLDE